MVMAQANRFNVRLVISPKVWVEVGMERSLTPSQQMTGLLYALDEVKKITEVQSLKLMFDEENETSTEEII